MPDISYFIPAEVIIRMDSETSNFPNIEWMIKNLCKMKLTDVSFSPTDLKIIVTLSPEANNA